MNKTEKAVLGAVAIAVIIMATVICWKMPAKMVETGYTTTVGSEIKLVHYVWANAFGIPLENGKELVFYELKD